MARKMRIWKTSLSLVFLGLPSVSCQNLLSSPLNEQFDPFDEDSSLSRGNKGDTEEICSIPPEQDSEEYIQPREGLCASSSIGLSDLSDSQIEALAVAYAPALFFHPLDEFTIETPDVIFRNPYSGQIYHEFEPGEFVQVDDTLNLTTMLSVSLPNPSRARDYFFAVLPPTDDYKRGAGFYYPDTDTTTTQARGAKRIGYSRASLYYSVFDAGFGTLVFNYYFFYPWNGPQTIGVGVGNKQFTVAEFDPYGAHEGDWEAMSMLVCAAPQESQPLAVTYRQHADSELTDCTKGQCIFYRGTNHAVGFSSLQSHATYPRSSRNHVYAAYPFNILYFWPAFFFFADQTVFKNEDTGEVRLFFPNTTNLLRLKSLPDIVAGPVQDYWQGFGGKWGDSFTRETVGPKKPPRCMNQQQTEFVDCPNVPLRDAMSYFLDSTATSTLACLVPALGDQLSFGSGPDGPIRKKFNDEWVAPESSLLWGIHGPLMVDEESFCKWLGTPVTMGQSEFSRLAFVLEVFFVVTAAASNVVGFFTGLFK